MRPSSSRLSSYQSKKFAKNKRLKSYFKTLLLIVVFFTVIFGLTELSYLNTIAIKDINVNGTRSDIAMKLTIETLKVIDGSYLGLFSKSNIFLYPKDRLIASALSAVPQIQSLSIERNGLVGLNINVKERQPKATICTSLPEFEQSGDLKINDNCFLADEHGLIFDSIISESKIPTNLYYIPSLPEATSTDTDLIGLYATSTEEFSKLQIFYDNARKVGMNPEFLLIKDDGEYELYANDVIIYFNNLRSFEEQFANLLSFWNHPAYKQYHQDLRSNFEYIDVRYGQNVFYRLIQ